MRKASPTPCSSQMRVKHDPWPRGVGDVVVEGISGRPTGHGALFHAIAQATIFRRLQQWNEMLLEVFEVLLHGSLGVPTDEPADGIGLEKHRGVEDPQHEIVLLATNLGIVMQHVVEVGDIPRARCDAPSGPPPHDARGSHRTPHAGRAYSRPDRASLPEARRPADGWSAAESWM